MDINTFLADARNSDILGFAGITITFIATALLANENWIASRRGTQISCAIAIVVYGYLTFLSATQEQFHTPE